MPAREPLDLPRRKKATKSAAGPYSRLVPNKRLTEKVVGTICRDVARGMSLRSIANRLLVLPDTLAFWRKTGDDYLQNDCQPPEDELYGCLVLGIRKGLGRRDCRIERQVMDPGNPNHQQFFRIAERLIPGVWGKDPVGGGDEAFNPDDRFL